MFEGERGWLVASAGSVGGAGETVVGYTGSAWWTGVQAPGDLATDSVCAEAAVAIAAANAVGA